MTPPLPIDRVLRFATLAAVGALGVLGFIAPESVLRSGVLWLGFLFFVLSGFGYVAVRAARLTDVDFGLRAAWGIAVFLAVAGVLIAIGICSRPVLLGLIALGYAGFAWRELTTPDPMWKQLTAGVAYARERPAIAL